MKKVFIKSLLILFLFAFTLNVFSQEITKYNYAEIVVLQKVAKNKSEIKQVYLNSTTDNNLEKSEISKIESISNLLKLMNDKNWEYVERLGSQPSNSGPIWISYTFRKKQ
jgi:Na+-translocating ferredoxin:NAD+ oxidoreductase RnfG subunit